VKRIVDVHRRRELEERISFGGGFVSSPGSRPGEAS